MKIYLLVLLLLNSLILPANAESRIVRTISTPSYQSQNDAAVYGNDLSAVENYLFGGDYRDDTVSSRLNRIERKLFSRCYPTLNPSQRMNNILANYQKHYNNRNYIDDYAYSRSYSPFQKFYNRFIGQPTGFTPPVMNLPFNDYGQPYGFNRGIYNNRGSYSYSNETPASSGFGVHIIDN